MSLILTEEITKHKHKEKKKRMKEKIKELRIQSL